MTVNVPIELKNILGDRISLSKSDVRILQGLDDYGQYVYASYLLGNKVYKEFDIGGHPQVSLDYYEEYRDLIHSDLHRSKDNYIDINLFDKVSNEAIASYVSHFNLVTNKFSAENMLASQTLNDQAIIRKEVLKGKDVFGMKENVHFINNIKVINDNNNILQDSVDLENTMVQGNIDSSAEVVAVKNGNDIAITDLNKLINENSGIDSKNDLSPLNNNAEYLSNLIMDSETSMVDDVTYDTSATQKNIASVGTLAGIDKRFVLLAAILFIVLIMPDNKVK